MVNPERWPIKTTHEELDLCTLPILKIQPVQDRVGVLPRFTFVMLCLHTYNLFSPKFYF